MKDKITITTDDFTKAHLKVMQGEGIKTITTKNPELFLLISLCFAELHRELFKEEDKEDGTV